MQLTLYDIIQDVTNVKLCEVCKQPAEVSLCSEKCKVYFISIYLVDYLG